MLVDSYGSKMPIKNVASISIEDAKSSYFSLGQKSYKNYREGIQESNLGLSVVSDGDGVRAIFQCLQQRIKQSL